jgi:hypothetical protein
MVEAKEATGRPCALWKGRCFKRGLVRIASVASHLLASALVGGSAHPQACLPAPGDQVMQPERTEWSIGQQRARSAQRKQERREDALRSSLLCASLCLLSQAGWWACDSQEPAENGPRIDLVAPEVSWPRRQPP